MNFSSSIYSPPAHARPRAHEWETVAGFVLSVPADRSAESCCLLKPVQAALQPLGLDLTLLNEICAAVEQAGSELRDNCPTGRLAGVQVRVLVSSQSLGSSSTCRQPWRFFILKQIASSESDNLDAVEDPACYIDLHILRE